MQPLGRDEQLDATVRRWKGKTRLGTERRLALHPGFIEAFDPDVRTCVGIAVHDLQAADDVALRMKRRSVWFQGRLHIGDGGQHFIANLDFLDRLASKLGVLRRDDGDRLARVADHIDP